MSARATDHSMTVLRLRETADILDRLAAGTRNRPADATRAFNDARRYRAVAALLVLHDEQRINLYDTPDVLVWVIFEAGQAIGPVTVENNYC